jgi:hypothetical protein
MQWSCHFEPEPSKLEHAEFLDLTGDPPMRRLAESLIRVLVKTGPVERFPDLEAPLKAIMERLVDLHPPTLHFYYHPAMAGSWSLKAVLPTIAPDMQYSKLEGIQEGTAASEGYLEAIHPDTSPERKAELKEQLLSGHQPRAQGRAQGTVAPLLQIRYRGHGAACAVSCYRTLQTGSQYVEEHIGALLAFAINPGEF